MAELPLFDPYKVLGVDRVAETTEIKKAYRKLALIKHPDKCPDATLRQSRTDEFQQLNEAYAILADEDKRKRHDALVKLDALRKEKASMGGGPRSFTRSATFNSGYTTGGASTAYTSRGATNVEDRAPRMSSYDDDLPSHSRRYPEFEYERRPQQKSPRERTKDEREADERRRGERKRDTGIRDARSRKYDYSDEKFSPYDDEKRRRERDDRDRPEEPTEKLRSKYADMEDQARGYTGVGGSPRTKPPMETRPSMGRRSSTRDVPPAYVRRSQAAPKESSRSQRDIDADQEILDRERRHLRELQADEKLRRKERERREVEREFESDRLRAREKEASRSRRENVEPYEKRPPTLQHTSSAPPLSREDDFLRERMSRTKTEPPHSNGHTPTMPRSNTMPPVSSSGPAKATRQPSKLRESHIPETEYSSTSTNASDHKQRPSAKPVQVRTYKYSREPSDEQIPMSEPRSSRRNHSPSPERPSTGAAKFANLAKSVKAANIATRRPSAVPSASSTRSIPMRTGRSPDRRRERERERDRDYTRDSRDSQLYGERTPQLPRDYARNISYSKPVREEDIIYSQRSSPRERERQSSYGFPTPTYHRTNSIPLSAMSS